MQDIQALAGAIGERNTQVPGSLDLAAEHIERRLQGCGYTVQRQVFVADGATVFNLEAILPGTARPDEVLVIGAHYDTARGTPGADDNASGVAALLELACTVSKRPAGRSIHWVAYVNEEPPYFQTAEMGSFVHAKSASAAGLNIVGMISLETIGYFRDGADTQHYPFPMGAFYPKRGDFLAFVGNRRSRKMVKQAITVFRSNARIPSEGGLAPNSVQGVGWSDHWSYWQHGIPALMVTDTAPFRNGNYHEPTDTPRTVDPYRLALAVEGLLPVVADLARVHSGGGF